MDEREFIRYMTEVIQLNNSKKYEEVIQLSNTIMTQFPERVRKPILWKAAALANLNQTDEAMEALLAGARQGEWWHPESLLKIRAFEPFHKRKEFQLLLDNGRTTATESTAMSNSYLKLRQGTESGPSILTFHWRGSNAKDFSEYWLEEDMDTTFGFAQSSQVFEKNSYCWDDSNQTQKDVHDMCEQFSDFQKGPLILGGASQGGKIALELVIKNDVKAVGFILLAPAVKELDEIVPYLHLAKERGIRGSIIVGEEDFLYERIQNLRKEMEQVDFPCQWIEVPNLGHFFPEDFSILLKDSVEYVLQREKVGDRHV